MKEQVKNKLLFLLLLCSMTIVLCCTPETDTECSSGFDYNYSTGNCEPRTLPGVS